MNSSASAITARTSDVELAHTHISYRRDIDGLRAFAVLAVVIFHAFPNYVPGGYVGVDVFFVISGYLITMVIIGDLKAERFSIANFYVRRVRRIFPALTLMLAATLAFGWKTILAEDLQQLAKHVFGGATFSSNFVLLTESGYFDKVSEAKPLLHLWSLGVEEQFYIVWPLLLAWAWRRRTYVPLLIGFILAASFALNVLMVGSHPTATFYSPLSRAWELLAGATVAVFSGRFAAIAIRRRDVMSWLGIVALCASVALLDNARRFPGWWALLPVVGSCLIIASGSQAILNRIALSGRFMVGVGLISYPLYLWHWPLLTLGRGLLPDSGSGRFGLLLASFALAILTYWFVEKPLRSGGKGPAKALALGGLMLGIAVAGATVFHGGGFPSRYPEIIQAATAYDLAGFRSGIRWKQCFIEFGEGPQEFAPECVEPGTSPLVGLWGDSGAASLYPGLRALAADAGNFRIIQTTSSVCPPLAAYTSAGRPACHSINIEALKLIRANAPDVMILAAIWQAYDRQLLGATIAKLREYGVRRVILIGPLPAWKAPPNGIVLKNWQDDPLHRLPPARLDYEKYGRFEQTSSRSALVEAELRLVAESAGAEYVSATAAVCKDNECLMRASDQSGASFYLDETHLNPTGSVDFMKRIASQLKLR